MQDRLFARLGLLMPLILVALGALWALSGIGTLIHLDEAEQMLVEAGLGRPLARITALAGSIADLAVAVALMWRRSARVALAAMVLLTLTYLAGGTSLMPELWIDPLAPFSKTLQSAASC